MGNNTVTNLYSWIERQSLRRWYVYILAIGLMIVSLFFATPKYLYLGAMPEVKEGWDVVVTKANDLTNNLSHVGAHTHHAKTVFRLTVPLFVKITGANQLMTYLFQVLLGFFMVVYCYKLILKLTENVVAATFIAACIMFLYFGRASLVDFSWYDGWAFFAIVMAMYSSRPWLVFLFCTMAAWTDERAVIVLPMILLFKQMENMNADAMVFKNLIKPNRLATMVLLAILCYAGLRMYLSATYDMHTPSASVNLYVLKENFHMMGVGIWTFFEGFWAIALLGMIFMLVRKHYVLSGLIVAQLFVSTAVALLVYDITRSGSYLVPLIFVFVKYLKENISQKELNDWLFIALIISFLFPAYYVIGGLSMNAPAYYEVIHYFLNKMYN